MTTRLHNYAEVRAYFEKQHPDWLRALTPRHINAPAEYWPQKVFAVSSVNAAMQNYVSIYEHQTRPNPALAVVHGQAALLLCYDGRLTMFQSWLPRCGRSFPMTWSSRRSRSHLMPWSSCCRKATPMDIGIKRSVSWKELIDRCNLVAVPLF